MHTALQRQLLREQRLPTMQSCAICVSAFDARLSLNLLNRHIACDSSMWKHLRITSSYDCDANDLGPG